MTDQPPVAPGATPEPVEPKSLPENLAEVAEALPPPNEIEERERGRTSLIAWVLLAAVFFGGLITMALTWRQASLPSMPEFNAPQIEMPWDGGDDRSPLSTTPPNNREGEMPPDMTEARGGNPDAVGRVDKPGGTEVPPRPSE